MSTSTAQARRRFMIRSPRGSAGPSPRARRARASACPLAEDLAAVLGVNKNAVLRALHMQRSK
jgi:hypothetical protein